MVLSELGNEFVRVGIQSTDAISQRSACILLAARSTSLLLGMLPLLSPDTRDSWDVLARSFMETRDLLLTIKVELEFPADLRLSRESETAIFRTVQECLTNIHRHSESVTARICIAPLGSDIRVEVEDQGKGIPPEKQFEMASTGTPGVGIRGMRERLRQLGGSLEIHSNGKGTLVVAQLPLSDTCSTRSSVTGWVVFRINWLLGVLPYCFKAAPRSTLPMNLQGSS